MAQKQYIPGNTELYNKTECDNTFVKITNANFVKSTGTTTVKNNFTLNGDVTLSGNVALGDNSKILDLGNTNIITKPSRDKAITIVTGGESFNDVSAGAVLSLIPRNRSGSDAGCFKLIAQDDTYNINNNTEKRLIGRPDGTLTWNGKSVALEENCLPLSGGIMTGTIVTKKNTILRHENDLSGLRIDGGSGWNHGASLILRGADCTEPNTTPGEAKIRVADNDNNKELIIKPDGTLTWNGKSVALAGDCLPVTGGNLSGTIRSYDLSNEGIEDINTVPVSAHQYSRFAYLYDKKGRAIGGIQVASYYDTGKTLAKFIQYRKKGDETDAAYIGVGHNSDGTRYTYAPNPSSSSNTTEIATTNWVTTKFNALLDKLEINI